MMTRASQGILAVTAAILVPFFSPSADAFSLASVPQQIAEVEAELEQLESAGRSKDFKIAGVIGAIRQATRESAEVQGDLDKFRGKTIDQLSTGEVKELLALRRRFDYLTEVLNGTQIWMGMDPQTGNPTNEGYVGKVYNETRAERVKCAAKAKALKARLSELLKQLKNVKIDDKKKKTSDDRGQAAGDKQLDPKALERQVGDQLARTDKHIRELGDLEKKERQAGKSVDDGKRTASANEQFLRGIPNPR